MLTDLDPRNICLDGTKLTTDFTRGVRLEIPQIDVRRAARHVNVYDRFVI